jgi:PucR family transcriptional regulator, purine catabolism regulatory protein
MITVADLLGEPSLRLTLAAGEGGLANTVGAAHVSELTRPSPWLQGGELLMTVGLLLPLDVPGCREYVADLVEGGVCGLVLGLGEELPHQGAPPSLVTAADEYGLPLLLLPGPIPFIAVVKWVFARLADAERREWQDAVGITRDLTAAAAGHDPLGSVLAAWTAALGTAAVVPNLGGAALASAGAGAESVTRRGQAALAEASHGVVASSTVVETDDVQILALGAAAPRGLLVLERSTDPRARHALAVLVSLLSLELDHRYASGNPERQRRAHAVTQLVSVGLRPELAPRLAASVGLPAGPLRVVVVRALERDRTDELAATLTASVHQAVARPRAFTVELLVPDIEDLIPILERAVPGRPVGVSALARVGDLHVSVRQADSLSQVSTHVGRPVQAEESGATRLLLQLGPPEVLTSYSDAVLAPLDRVDARERAELLHTVEEWLRANGVWEAAATNLSVHRNTVRNRIARVASLLGRPLDDADQRMEVWLALQARAAVLRTRPGEARPGMDRPVGGL